MIKSGFEMGCLFNGCVADLSAYIARVLVERVGVKPEVASSIKCIPSTSEPFELLPNGEQ